MWTLDTKINKLMIVESVVRLEEQPIELEGVRGASSFAW